MKKLFFAFFICITTTLNAIPPTLAWKSSCWNEAVFLLLRNIKPLSDYLTSANNVPSGLAYDYAELLKITNSAFGITVSEKEMLSFWSSSCKNMQLPYMQAASAGEFLSAILEDIKMYSSVYLNIAYSINGTIILNQVYDIELNKQNDSVEKALQAKRAKLITIGDFIIFKTPYSRANTTVVLPLTIDLGPYLKTIEGSGKNLKFLPQKTQPGEWQYELIGIGVYQPDFHYYAYIKDQYEKSPNWYYCWGVGSSPLKVPEQNMVKKCAAWNSGSKKDLNGRNDAADWPQVLVYKRLPYTPKKPTESLDAFAQALNDIK